MVESGDIDALAQPTAEVDVPIPSLPADPRDLSFADWADSSHHDLRRMLRYLRSRMSHGHGHGHIDWDGVALSLARYVYATSANRHKTNPAIR